MAAGRPHSTLPSEVPRFAQRCAPRSARNDNLTYVALDRCGPLRPPTRYDPPMDLTFGSEHEALRQEVRAFLEAHRDQAVPERGEGADRARTLAWQKTLVEHGYAGRARCPGSTAASAPRPTSLEYVVIDDEFARARVFSRHGEPGHLDVRAHRAALRQRGAEAPLRRPHHPRRDDLVPGLQRARRPAATSPACAPAAASTATSA